jgi:hypothetical protein
MTTLPLAAGYAAPAWDGFIRILAAVTAAFEGVFEVFAEAEHQSSAARSRYPLAD